MAKCGWTGRRVLFLSGTAGDTRRYRCHYQAEQLRMLGALVAVRALEEPGAEQALAFAPDLVVFHRARWSDEVARLLDELKGRGTPLVYDTDDLVVTSVAAPLVEWPPDLTEDERREFFDSHRRVMDACGLATVSTSPLAEAALDIAQTAVTPNAVGMEMLAEADAALAEERRPDEPVTITYLSGTATHQADFELVADVLVELLRRPCRAPAASAVEPASLRAGTAAAIATSCGSRTSWARRVTCRTSRSCRSRT
jgi:hypothetical protein